MKLDLEYAKRLFEKSNFVVRDIDKNGCGGTYHFRIWGKNNQNNIDIGLMQFIEAEKIDLHIMVGSSTRKFYPTTAEIEEYLEKIAKISLSQSLAMREADWEILLLGHIDQEAEKIRKLFSSIPD